VWIGRKARLEGNAVQRRLRGLVEQPRERDLGAYHVLRVVRTGRLDLEGVLQPDPQADRPRVRGQAQRFVQ